MDDTEDWLADMELENELSTTADALALVRRKLGFRQGRLSRLQARNIMGFIGVARAHIETAEELLREGASTVGTVPTQNIEEDHDRYERVQLEAKRYKRREER